MYKRQAGFACVGAALAVWVGGNLGLAWMQFRLSRQIVAAAAEMHIAVELSLIHIYQLVANVLGDEGFTSSLGIDDLNFILNHGDDEEG